MIWNVEFPEKSTCFLWMTKLLVSYIYRLRCWRPRPSRLAPAPASLASWTGPPGSDGTAGRTPPLWCSRASTAGSPSAGWSGCTAGNNAFKSPSPASCHFLIKTWRRQSSYVLDGDVLHQQLLQFLLFEPPARAERADGHRRTKSPKSIRWSAEGDHLLLCHVSAVKLPPYVRLWTTITGIMSPILLY